MSLNPRLAPWIHTSFTGWIIYPPECVSQRNGWTLTYSKQETCLYNTGPDPFFRHLMSTWLFCLSCWWGDTTYLSFLHSLVYWSRFPCLQGLLYSSPVYRSGSMYYMSTGLLYLFSMLTWLSLPSLLFIVLPVPQFHFYRACPTCLFCLQVCLYVYWTGSASLLYVQHLLYLSPMLQSLFQLSPIYKGSPASCLQKTLSFSCLHDLLCLCCLQALPVAHV